ncbi:MAG TPA: DUF1254 domain-containing protein [Solirubrobacteraceae bacterium]|nr:DUF1254 domain-containing protein [Solirubrobacteraceae bacterium]
MGTTESADGVERVRLAAEVYIYGYPLVYNLHEIDGFTSNIGSVPFSAPYNRFGYARALLGPETEFVSPNNDTLYVAAACDVRQGPLVLHVPDTGGRYYVLQFVDAWTNNFAYIGRRATGTTEDEFLLAGDGWAGDAPADMRLVSAPTGIFMIVGRLQVDGEPDLPAVHALQDQFTITPLSVDDGGPAPAAPGAPRPDPRAREDLQWWERLRVALIAFPPPQADARFVELAASFGATAAESPYVNPDPALAEVLVAGVAAGQQKIEELMQGAGQEAINGWNSAMHSFDYNLDHLGLGTLDRPDWKIQDRARAYATRAAAARGGLWGNHGYEATYAMAWTDADGAPLDGAHNRYELRLSPPPPVDAFWSLTMYDASDFYLVANAIDRYSIGDRTAGLLSDDDGSVTIYIQRDAPDGDRQSNWLPTPDGRFRPLMRMYEPRAEILNGEYTLPAITKAG